jgi:hypothetical protein
LGPNRQENPQEKRKFLVRIMFLFSFLFFVK